MAKRFSCAFYDERAARYDIEIWDTAFSGTATTFRTTPQGFALRYAQVSERTDVFMPTECSVVMMMQSSTHEALITDLLAAAEGRFTIKITKGAIPVLFWAGMVLPDIGRYNEQNFPTEFEIKATDGLGLLKDIEFNDAGAAYTGKQRIIQHIATCLGKLPWVATHYGGSDHFIKSHVDWWEATMTNSASGSDALYQAYLDHAVWWKYDKGEQKFLSCYQVLLNILTVLGARITHAEGAFWIEQLTYRVAETIVTRRYSTAGGFLSTANYTGLNTINQTGTGALMATGSYEFFPGLSKAEHIFKAFERRNYLSGAKINEVTDTQRLFFPLQSGGGTTKLRLTGNLVGSVFNTGPQPPIVPQLAVVFKITVELETKSAKRDYTLDPNYQVNYLASEWDTSPQVCYYVVTLPGGLPTAGAYYTQQVDIELPGVPENCDSFLFGIEFDSFRYFTGATLSPSSYVFRWDFQNPWLEVYTNGNPSLTADEVAYETLNTIHTTNSAQHESESLIGYTTDPNTIGAIWVKPSSAYVLGGNWGEGTDTPDRPVEKLLTEFVVSGQRAPIRRLQGRLFGDIVAMRRVSFDSALWLLLGGTWNAGSNEFEGEWVELDYAPGLNASPPRRRRLTLIDPPVPTAPVRGLNGASSQYEIVSKPPGTLLYPVSQATSGDSIAAGAITSLPVSAALEDSDFVAGDTITLLNPITGIYEDLLVGTTSVATDTAIDVSGTLAYDYPPNCPIIRKPLSGTFGLPGGAEGQILWHNGSRWQGYGSASMTDGHVLTWNDATGWTAQAPSGGVTGSGTAGQVAFWSGTGAITGENNFAYSSGDLRIGPSGGDHVRIEPGNSAIHFFDSGNIDAILKANVNVLETNVGMLIGGNSQVSGALAVTGSITTNAHFKAPGITSSSVASPDSAPAGAFSAWAATGADSFVTFSESGIAYRGAFGFLAGAGDMIWTMGAFLLSAGTERMRLTNAGRLGIGTNSPSQMLHVVGAARIMGSAGTATMILGRDADGNLNTYTLVVGDIPNLPASIITSGVLPMVRGGTGTGTAGTAGQLARMNGAADALEFFTATYLTGNQTITLSGDVTGSGTTSITTTIANNVVTLAKFQQIATASILGRQSAGTGNVEVLTGAQARSVIGALAGTLTSGRIPFSVGGNDLSDDALLTWNFSTKRLSVGNTGGSPVASVHIAEGSVASWEALRAAGTVSGNMVATLYNVQNTGGASNMLFDLITGGSSGGDPVLRWLVNGVGTWSAGVDNSNSDKWILGYQALPGGGSDWVTVTTTGQVGIQNNSPAHPLDVSGRARATLVAGVNGTFGTTFGTGAGTSPSLTQLQGSSNGFVFAFTTGTGPTANANIMTFTLPLGFPSAMYPTFSAGNAQTATDIAKFYINSAGTSVLVLRANGTLSASTAYKLYFTISGI